MAGLEIAFRCETLSLGKRTPELVELISRIEEGSGVIVPIPTCE